MRARKARLAAVIPLIACALAGCGGSDDEEPKPVPGKTVGGETETGMKLKVDTFVDPANDPQLKKLADWRASNRYPVVDYHRVTADNSAGQTPDSGRTVRFAVGADALAGRQGHRGPLQLRRARVRVGSGQGVRHRALAGADRRALRRRPAEAGRHRPRVAQGLLPRHRSRVRRARHPHDAGVRPARRAVQVVRRAAAFAAARRQRSYGVVVDSVSRIVLP